MEVKRGRRVLRALRLGFRAAVLGAVVWLAVAYWPEIVAAARQLREVSLVVLLVIPCYVAFNWAAAVGWRQLIAAADRGSRPPSIWTLWLIRVQAQAINLLLPAASVGGEVLRAAALTRRTRRGVESTSAVMLDNLANASAGVVFAVAWLATGWRLYPDDGPPLTLVSAVGLAVVAAFTSLPVVLAAVARRMRAREGSRLARLLELFRESPRRLVLAYAHSTAWHLVERMLTAVEIYIAMRALGLDAGLWEAVFATAMMTGLSLVFFFVPGQLGPADLGIVAAFAAIGLPPAAGLSVALIRRSRQALVMLVGVVLIVIDGRDREVRAPVSSEGASP